MTTACPSAASVGASTIASTSASAHVTFGNTSLPDERAGNDRERQADAQQACGYCVFAPERAQVDARGIGEQNDDERGLGERTDRLLGRSVTCNQPSTSGPARNPAPTNTIAAVIDVPSNWRDSAAYARKTAAMMRRLWLSTVDAYRETAPLGSRTRYAMISASGKKNRLRMK